MDNCTLRLAQHVHLGNAYTIAFWTFTPMPHGWPHQYWRDLLDGSDEWRLPVAMRGNFIGNAGAAHGDNMTTFNLADLADGWHHVVAVGAAGITRYFVDGKFVGSLDSQYMGVIGAVGNRYDALVQEAWGVLSDLQIYEVA